LLETLDLSKNYIKVIPHEIGHLLKITSIILRDNQIEKISR